VSLRGIAFATLFLLLAPAGKAFAQSWQPPTAAERCPSKWGAADERGAANLVTPERVAQAAKLIRTGEVFELGRVLSPDMPLFTGRSFNLYTKRTNGPLGSNKRYSNEEVVTTEIGQVGTQLDMFAHQGIDGLFYNCVKINEAATRNGFSKLGVDKIGALFARGVLVDVAGLKGVDMLPVDYEIGVADLEAALARQHVTLGAGDAVLIHTGWGGLWGVDNTKYATSSPGIGIAAAEWLAKQNVLLIGGDTAPVEILPNPDKQLDLPVHQIALVVNGIFLLENLKLDQLAGKHIYEFALLVEPLKIKGGTGSTVAPIAIH
jgi:kynurenine formamidase